MKVGAEIPADNKRGPILTWITCAACIAIFIEISQGKSQIRETFFSLTSAGVRAGNYWGLVTSVFTHVQLWHLVLNVYWLWIIGGVLEAGIGRFKWTVLFLAAAVISSGAQFIVSGTTGIGASGVVYAMFGFLWIGRELYPDFKRVATRQNVTLFLGWMVLCVIATRLHILSVGNTAHVSGLLFGAGAAHLARTHRAQRTQVDGEQLQTGASGDQL
jgi:membrane associated rhomboid family serine protease